MTDGVRGGVAGGVAGGVTDGVTDCPTCGGTGNSTPDPYGVCRACSGLGRIPGPKVAAVMIVEERSAASKGGPWSEPVPVGLAATREDLPWCEPYVVSNRWVQSRAVRYERVDVAALTR